MFLATTNKAKRLLYVGFIQQVRSKDLQRGLEEMPALLADLPPGFNFWWTWAGWNPWNPLA